jgi:hypothetical protein
VRRDGVAAALLELADDRLEPLVRERLDLAAVVADEVVVMVVVVANRLVARDPVADVEPLQEATLGERVQDAVDARQAHRGAGGPELVVDLLRAEAAGLLVEELDHREARCPVPVSGLPELGEGAFRPGSSVSGHAVDDNGDENRYRLA